MSKRMFILCSVLLIPTLLIGCTTETTVTNNSSNGVNTITKSESGTITEISDEKVAFKLHQGVDRDELLTYDGDKVEFYGHMSLDHPNNDLAIITFNPEGLCPFHADITLEKEIAMPVNVVDKEQLTHTYSPVKVEGVLKVDSYTDSSNHSFNFIIDDAKITKVTPDKATGMLKDYISLAEKGVFELIRYEQVAIDEALGYKIFGKDLKSLRKVNTDNIEKAKDIIKEFETDEFSDLLESLNLAIDNGKKVNEALDKKDLNLLEDHSLIINTQRMFELYQLWQLKYSI